MKHFGERDWAIGLAHRMLSETRIPPVWPDWAIYCTLDNHSKPVATIILPKLFTLLGNFCKGVKIIHFSSDNFYRHLTIFIWSHWIPPPLCAPKADWPISRYCPFTEYLLKCSRAECKQMSSTPTFASFSFLFTLNRVKNNLPPWHKEAIYINTSLRCARWCYLTSSA